MNMNTHPSQPGEQRPNDTFGGEGFTLDQCRELAADLKALRDAGKLPGKLGASDPERVEWLLASHAQSQARIAELADALRMCRNQLFIDGEDVNGWLIDIVDRLLSATANPESK
jgi:hypothetical protein